MQTHRALCIVLGMMEQATQYTPPYMDGLNPEQRQAVETTEGPLLVLAGAGTGKTRVLTTRIAHILQSQKAYPAQILAVTFTNKAAAEMKERVASIIGDAPLNSWFMGTFHSVCVRMLRKHAELAGLNSNFTILDSDDQIRLMKQIMEQHNVDTKKSAPRAVLSIIDRWKDKARTPDMITSDEVGDFAECKMLILYKAYQQRLLSINACDFNDLILHVINILKNPNNRHILEGYHAQFKYILVDEYQDTNVAQYLWLRLLAQGSQNICCVGDDDQSIYGWRGAEVGNILKFEQDFSGAKIIRLQQNYRSTEHILKAAGGIISRNENRLGKDLWSEQGDGEKITVKGLWDNQAEARWVGEQITKLQHLNKPLSQMAVLIRTGFQTRDFEERFISLGLPYKVIGGPRFYERMEIRVALAYLRVIAQPSDDLALERVINTPKRGLGGATVGLLHQHARASNISLYESIRQLCETDELRPKVKSTLISLIENFENWRSAFEETDHVEATARVLDESGYIDMWKNDKAPDSPGRVENLQELGKAMTEFENLTEFLEHIALVMEAQSNDSNAEQISIMTLHGSKGLEFDTVFLPGWEEGLFPSQRSMDESGMKGLEEERRLAYVGITRARKKAFISYAGNRFMYGNWVTSMPSRFVNELPADNIISDSEQGIYNREESRSSHWDSSGSSSRTSWTSRKPSGPQVSQTTQKIQAKAAKTSSHPFKPGTKVKHAKFGQGTVIHLDGHKLDIKFDRGGVKRILDNFVERIES